MQSETFKNKCWLKYSFARVLEYRWTSGPGEHLFVTTIKNLIIVCPRFGQNYCNVGFLCQEFYFIMIYFILVYHCLLPICICIVSFEVCCLTGWLNGSLSLLENGRPLILMETNLIRDGNMREKNNLKVLLSSSVERAHVSWFLAKKRSLRVAAYL